MPARRSNYTLLSQVPDEQFVTSSAGAPTSFYESSLSGESKNNNKLKAERPLDWDAVGDHRGNRIGNLYSSIGLQRQSSGSSFGESSLSGEYYAPTLSTSAANEIDGLGTYTHDDVFRIGEFRAKAVGKHRRRVLFSEELGPADGGELPIAACFGVAALVGGNLCR